MCIRTVFARFLRFLRQKTARTKVATLNLHIFSHTNMHNFRAQVCAPCHVDYLVVFHFFFFVFWHNLTNKARGTTLRMRNIALEASMQQAKFFFSAHIWPLLFADFTFFFGCAFV